MHCLTSQGNWELRIDYKLKNGTESYLHYNNFAIGSAEDQYPLNISGYDSIGLTDPFISGSRLNGMKFTSRDQDNDLLGVVIVEDTVDGGIIPAITYSLIENMKTFS